MDNTVETVTITLKTYKGIKQELRKASERIEFLEEEVKKKTVVKYHWHPIYGQVAVILIVTATYVVTTFLFTR